MNEPGLIAIITAAIAAAVSLGGVIGKAWSDYRATESAEEMDDRKALRTYYETELALCRAKLEKTESVKDRSIALLEHFAEMLEHKEARERQTGGPS